MNNKPKDFGKQWYRMTVEEVLAFLVVYQNSGVSAKDVFNRSKQFGENIDINETVISRMYKTSVLRDGKRQTISVKNIVIGDIVLLSQGDIVGADMRIIDVDKCLVQEEYVTGSSAVVTKNSYAIRGVCPVNHQRNMLFKGASITSGSAKAVVVRIGESCFIHKTLAKLSSNKHSLRNRRKIAKFEKSQIFVQNADVLASLKDIDTIVINIPLNADSVKEAIRVLDVGKKKNLIFVTDSNIYRKWVSEIPGILFIDKQAFDTNSNKSLLENDHPLLALLDVEQADILRYIKLLKIKNRDILWLDDGKDSQLSGAAATSIIIADSAKPLSISEADIVLPTANKNEWIRKIEKLV